MNWQTLLFQKEMDRQEKKLLSQRKLIAKKNYSKYWNTNIFLKDLNEEQINDLVKYYYWRFDDIKFKHIEAVKII